MTNGIFLSTCKNEIFNRKTKIITYVKSLKLNFPFGLIQEICLKYDVGSIIKYHMFWFFLSKYDVFLSSELKTIVDLDRTCTCNILINI